MGFVADVLLPCAERSGGFAVLPYALCFFTYHLQVVSQIESFLLSETQEISRESSLLCWAFLYQRINAFLRSVL